MNKQDLAKALKNNERLVIGSAYMANMVIDALLCEIMDALARGEEVCLHGFGTFTPKIRAKTTKASLTVPGKYIEVPERIMPVFKSGLTFKGKVAKRDGT